MPRKPDPNSKVPDIHYHPKTEEEDKEARGFKEVCARDNIEMRGVVKKAIKKFLKEHNWPPGNPQLMLAEFGCTQMFECWRCEQMFPELAKTEFISGVIGDICPGCLKYCREHRTVKRVLQG